jgi:hypothetical protein
MTRRVESGHNAASQFSTPSAHSAARIQRDDDFCR